MATLQLSTSAEDSEERLLLSLNRLGTPKARPTRPHQLTQPIRRRFVKDGEVPIEYAGRHEPVSEADEAVASLRAELAAEQAGREESEQALTAAKAVNRTLQTRIGHMELELEELRARAARAAAEAVEAARQLEAKPVRITKPAGIVSDDEEDDPDGPQPVKWWLKK